jgi:hypothetical protein
MLFGKQKAAKDGEIKLPGPKEIPDMAGRYMVMELKKEPDWVWQLKGVTRPADKKKAYYCRVFDETQTRKANVKVENWTSLDGHPELILWEGYCDDEAHTSRAEKFVEPAE